MTHLIQELKSKIENGINWEKAVVDCISDWDISEEFYRGYKYKYWINNEAFDWMTLTERLGSAIKSYLSKKKYHELIFTGLLPNKSSYEYMKKVISKNKLSQMRNFYYGIIIEDLIYIQKSQQYLKNSLYSINEYDGYEEIYGKNINLLFQQFAKNIKFTRQNTINLYTYKEFIYWLFKFRIKYSEKTKVASDTNLSIKLAKDILNEKITMLF
ncbi:MAG: hypothetical protein FI681_03660 [SAR202 cluster bacterium]|nr:hypothetical protein [SAR202 cluster bacterium]|tara:strand:- start:919 stop:1557 length:639 start_codon:yes stop_codon:yes gene_type:complete